MDQLVYVGEEGEVTSGPRQRLIDSAIAMMRERGVHATGLADLLKRSGTARNSIYQHFPEGKAELIAAAEREASDLANGFLDALRAVAMRNTCSLGSSRGGSISSRRMTSTPGARMPRPRSPARGGADPGGGPRRFHRDAHPAGGVLP